MDFIEICRWNLKKKLRKRGYLSRILANCRVTHVCFLLYAELTSIVQFIILVLSAPQFMTIYGNSSLWSCLFWKRIPLNAWWPDDTCKLPPAQAYWAEGGLRRHLSPTSIAGTVPTLVPFTLNFTITNLHYEEDMGRLGSWKFNATERVLQGLVRALPTSLLPQLLKLAHLIPTTPIELTLTIAPTHFCPNHQYKTHLPKCHTCGSRLHPSYLYLHGYKPSPLIPAPSISLLPCPPTYFPFPLLQLRILFKNSSVGPLYLGCSLTMLR